MRDGEKIEGRSTCRTPRRGTRWFADKQIWVEDPSAGDARRFQPFATPEAADAYLADHSGAKVVSYDEAVRRA